MPDDIENSKPEDDDYWRERDGELLERGLKLHDQYCKQMEAEEAERDAAEESAKARGETFVFSLTNEERAWDEYHDRQLSGIAFSHKKLLVAFDLNPRKSALCNEFPDLLRWAFNPQSPVHYDPSERQFALMETWGPAVNTIAYCPITGKTLPDPLGEVWPDLVSKELGTEDWSYDEAREKLPDFFTEAWWIERGL